MKQLAFDFAIEPGYAGDLAAFTGPFLWECGAAVTPCGLDRLWWPVAVVTPRLHRLPVSP